MLYSLLCSLPAIFDLFSGVVDTILGRCWFLPNALFKRKKPAFSIRYLRSKYNRHSCLLEKRGSPVGYYRTERGSAESWSLLWTTKFLR